MRYYHIEEKAHTLRHILTDLMRVHMNVAPVYSGYLGSKHGVNIAV